MTIIGKWYKNIMDNRKYIIFLFVFVVLVPFMTIWYMASFNIEISGSSLAIAGYKLLWGIIGVVFCKISDLIGER